MSQASKPTKPTAAERNEKVRQVLLAACEPLGPGEIAAKIGEPWCSWNGAGRGSAVVPALTQIGARRSRGKWSMPASEPGCVGEMGLTPPSVMSVASWERLKEAMAVPQQ